MSLILRPSELGDCAPKAGALHAVLSTTCDRFDISTPQRQCAFLAEGAWESEGFSDFEEDLSYNAERLCAVWPTRFFLPPQPAIRRPGEKPRRDARLYARKPRELANLVYANRLGNGPPESDMGYRFRGRGVFQLTGFDNYMAASIALYGTDELVQTPDRVMQPLDACLTAGHFWDVNSLSALADLDTYAGFERLTRKINVAAHGLDDHDPRDLDSRVDWWNLFRCAYKLPEIRR